MCEMPGSSNSERTFARTIPVSDGVGTVLAHDITEIVPGEFKGRAFRKGHIIKEDDVAHLKRLGKEKLFVLDIGNGEMHEDEAAGMLADALCGEGVVKKEEPKEGKVDIIAGTDGILCVKKDALYSFNMTGEVMCASLHDRTIVRKGQTVAGTRAIPLVVRRDIVETAAGIARRTNGIISVKRMRKPKTGIVITGNEVFHGRIKDAFAPVITRKVEALDGEVVGVCYAPDDESVIEARLRELLAAGADLLITTGGMSVDPDDVTRFAIRNLGATEITYGSAVLPGSMFLVAYIDGLPVLGIPACGMYSRTTVFDLILPRVLAGERIGRKELAELGHGGFCLHCPECRYPVCPFGK